MRFKGVFDEFNVLVFLGGFLCGDAFDEFGFFL